METQSPVYRRSTPLRSLARLLLAAPLLCLGLTAHAARNPQPAIRLKLEDLGIPATSQILQASGASVLGAYFVDNTHLLVTYGLRGLVERIPDDPPEHNDRAVAAILVELPTGKVLARARWHLHDYYRYIWPLGNGRFLLRIQSRLVAIAPMSNLASGDAFHQMPFIRPAGNIDAILISPEGDLVTVETSPIRRRLPKPNLNTPATSTTPAAASAAAAPAPPTPAPAQDNAPDPAPSGPVDFFFLRVAGAGTVEEPIYAISAGTLKSPTIGVLPINGRGLLSARSRKKNLWTMQYDGIDGDSRKLSDVNSSCPPTMQFLGSSDLLVFSCRGADDRILISEFNFLNHEMWEEPMPGANNFGLFAFAPQAGRFALSRTVMTVSPQQPGVAVTGEGGSSTSQDIRVYQSESGDMLLKLTPNPTAPAGQNFDLSTDGMNFLVITDGSIDIYKLPALTTNDKRDLADLTPVEPPVAKNTFIDVRRLLRHAAEDSLDPIPAVVGDADRGIIIATTPPTGAPVSPSGVVVNGDAQGHRPPPTLLNPGEKPEFADKKKKTPE